MKVKRFARLRGIKVRPDVDTQSQASVTPVVRCVPGARMRVNPAFPPPFPQPAHLLSFFSLVPTTFSYGYYTSRIRKRCASLRQLQRFCKCFTITRHALNNLLSKIAIYITDIQVVKLTKIFCRCS